MTGCFKYTYISNKEFAIPPTDFNLPGACQATSKTLNFDPVFQSCLFAIGQAKGVARDWTFVDAR